LPARLAKEIAPRDAVQRAQEIRPDGGVGGSAGRDVIIGLGRCLERNVVLSCSTGKLRPTRRQLTDLRLFLGDAASDERAFEVRQLRVEHEFVAMDVLPMNENPDGRFVWHGDTPST
jgi:hypothetical protein